jgi:hypothetical protein
MRKIVDIEFCCVCPFSEVIGEIGCKYKDGPEVTDLFKMPIDCPLPNAPQEGAHCEDKR